MKRGRGAGKRRVRRQSAHAARQSEAEAKEADVLQRYAELEASVAAERARELALAAAPSDIPLHGKSRRKLDAVVAKFDRGLKAQLDTTRNRLRASTGNRIVGNAARVFEDVERVVARDAANAGTAVQLLVERMRVEQLRARQLSKRQVAVLAREITAQLGQAELAIQDAWLACDSAAREAEHWTFAVTAAVRDERDDLEKAARDRVEQCRSNVNLTDSALRACVEQYGRLSRLGRVLLEIAGE